MLVTVFFVQGGVTIHLLSARWRLADINIVDCTEWSMKYTSKSRNEYAFMASTFLEVLKSHNGIWNSTATVAPN